MDNLSENNNRENKIIFDVLFDRPLLAAEKRSGRWETPGVVAFLMPD
jgi:hypothetical protein